MMGLLAEAGHTFVETDDRATAVLINTCAFITSATAESMEVIEEYVDKKLGGRIDLLVVTGCLPQRETESLRKRFPQVDVWLGTGDFDRIVEAMEVAGTGEYYCRISSPRLLPESRVQRIRTTPSHYAYLKVADGCSNRCSYCVIPQLRGEYRSRSIDAILQEAAELAASGARELILVAQDVTRFGMDRSATGELPRLIELLSRVEDVYWIRLMYAYPTRITDQVVDAVASVPKVVHYIDMPIQHASSRLLRKMNRPYSRTDLRRLVRSIRRRIPDVALRTTVMVGFPGETEGHFERLLEFIGEIRFDRLGAFCYSPEDATAAAVMAGQIPEETKRHRLDAVMQLQQRISLEHNRALVGTRMEVLVDGFAEGTQGLAVGRTYRDAPEIDGEVYVTGYDGQAGGFVNVEITDADVYDLHGIVVR